MNIHFWYLEPKKIVFRMCINVSVYTSVASSSIQITEPILTKFVLNLYFWSTHMREKLFLEVLKVKPTHILAKNIANLFVQQL